MIDMKIIGFDFKHIFSLMTSSFMIVSPMKEKKNCFVRKCQKESNSRQSLGNLFIFFYNSIDGSFWRLFYVIQQRLDIL